MGKTQTIFHKGKAVFYIDFSGLKTEPEIAAVIEEGKAFIRSKPPKSVYSLTNIEEMHFNSNIKELFSDFVKGNKEHVKASAVIGVNGMKQILFNGIMKITGRDIRSLNSKEQALDWLTADTLL